MADLPNNFPRKTLVLSGALVILTGLVASSIASVAENSLDLAAEEARTEHTYYCSLDGKTRRIEVNYPQHSLPLPCEVNYYKDDEAPGQTQTLWHANVQMGFCEVKADRFVGQLQDWGWECE